MRDSSAEGSPGLARPGGGPDAPVVLVVGGGIAGLAAARHLQRHGARAVVLEASGRLGGKLQTTTFAGRDVDLGPDAFLARVPHAVALARELGLEEDLVPPATGQAYLWSRGALRPLPRDLALGVPTRLRPLLGSGIVSPMGIARAGLDLVVPNRGAEPEEAVGHLVARRLGHEVAERLADPLIGGINAGRSELLELVTATPSLAGPASHSGSLLRSLRHAAPAPTEPGGPRPPVFYGLRRGLGSLVAGLAAALEREGSEIRLSSPVGTLELAGNTFTCRVAGEALVAAGVVVALPPSPASRVLAGLVPGAASELRAIESSSVSVVTFAYPSDAVGVLPAGSGFLVPRGEGRLLTAATWLSVKWPHLARRGDVLIRASAGRYQDGRAASLSDGGLARRLHGELTEALHLSGPPDEVLVQRWPDAFPQYAPGHERRVRRIEQEVAACGPLALAGSAYHGVGIPACIAGGERAASAVLEALAGRRREQLPGGQPGTPGHPAGLAGPS